MKKALPTIIGALLTLVVASAAYALLPGFLPGLEDEDTAAMSPPPPRVVVEPPTRPAEAKQILEGNAFGASRGASTPVPSAPPEQEPADPIDEEPGRGSPACSFGEVTTIVTGSPSYAFALVNTKSVSGQILHIGSSIEERLVEAIDWDRVWFSSEDGPCQMRLGDPLPGQRKAKRARKPKKRKKKKKKKKRNWKPEDVPEHVSDLIQKLGPNRFSLDRRALEVVFSAQAGLVRGTHVDPVKEGEETVGVKLWGRGTYPGSLLHSIGIRENDMLTSINGFSPTTPQKALELYGRIRSANQVTLKLMRHGQPVTVTYAIH
jgi:general secretion pathway protein C